MAKRTVRKKITIPYCPRGLQTDFHQNIKRWNVVVTHRRFGKTVMVINQLVKDALMSKKERPRYAYVSPYLVQTKQIAWDYLKFYTAVLPGKKYHEGELKVTLHNGATIQLLGADNPDRLRGIYLDGIALDEYAQIKPSLFTEIILPALSDRSGYAIFLGTPKGKNHFYDLYQQSLSDPEWYTVVHKASDTKYIDAEELERARKLLSKDEYEQEFECSFEAAIKGAFYASEVAEIKEQNRISKSIYNDNLPVHTAWDIGFRDDTAIIFFQLFGKEVRIIDSYSNSGLALPDYIRLLRSKPYQYATHYFPWDARIKPMSSGKSTIDMAHEYGLDNVKITPSLSVQEGIQQCRNILKRCWFEEDTTKELINALSQYRREWDDGKKAFRATPLHDWSSHFADAMRYLAISLKEVSAHDKQEYVEAASKYTGERDKHIPPNWLKPSKFQEEQMAMQQYITNNSI